MYISHLDVLLNLPLLTDDTGLEDLEDRYLSVLLIPFLGG